MMFSSERREIMHAQLMLPIYGQLVDSDSKNLESEEAQLTYTNKEAQNYLRKVTEPCFAHLKCLYERLKKTSWIRCVKIAIRQLRLVRDWRA